MRKWPGGFRFLRKPRYMSLQNRLILSSSAIVTLLLVIMAVVVSHQQSKTIMEQVERRGLAIAQSLAATSKAALTTYDYIALSRDANQAVQDPDLAYVIIHDKEGRVAGYSGRADLEGKFLSDDLSLKASSTSKPLTQNTLLGETRTPVLDIAVPVFIPGSEKPWGVVRIALSLAPMYRQIHLVQLTICAVGIVALILTILTCIWLARRITNPLDLLVKATISAARGNLDQEIRISTGDEVEVLADNFSIMIREILLQRRRLENNLLEITALERYLKQLLDTMGDGLLSIDMEGNLVTVNPAACQILGRCADNWQARPAITEILKELPELLDYVRGALENPFSACQEELCVEIGNEVKNIIVASGVLADEADKPLQVIVNVHDVTVLKKLEAQFRQAERLAALGTLSAGLAHEIRNPLSAIKTFVQLLPRKLDRPGFLEKFQRTVPRELDRINRLIEDLLELARAPKYKLKLLDVLPIIEQTIELFEEEMAARNIECHLENESALPLIWGSPDQLAKAFHNIIRNAVQAMTAGGELCIRTRAELSQSREASSSNSSIVPPRCRLTLEFCDTGAGIEPEDLKSIFNPFFTTKDSGTGLGLAVTYKVISEHGGEIQVDSTPGKGACFTINLPARVDHQIARLSTAGTAAHSNV